MSFLTVPKYTGRFKVLGRKSRQFINGCPAKNTFEPDKNIYVVTHPEEFVLVHADAIRRGIASPYRNTLFMADPSAPPLGADVPVIGNKINRKAYKQLVAWLNQGVISRDNFTSLFFDNGSIERFVLPAQGVQVDALSLSEDIIGVRDLFKCCREELVVYFNLSYFYGPFVQELSRPGVMTVDKWGVFEDENPHLEKIHWEITKIAALLLFLIDKGVNISYYIIAMDPLSWDSVAEKDRERFYENIEEIFRRLWVSLPVNKVVAYRLMGYLCGGSPEKKDFIWPAEAFAPPMVRLDNE